MANISTLLKSIKEAVFGKDVRNSIHDAIKQCYDDAIANGHTDMEIVEARGNFKNLEDRLEADTNNRKEADANLQSQINGLASGSPLAASSVSEMTDVKKVYVNTSDGHWYYYDSFSWVDGGVYQSTEIEDRSIEPKMTTFFECKLRQLLQVSDKAKTTYFGLTYSISNNTYTIYPESTGANDINIVIKDNVQLAKGKYVFYIDKNEDFSINTTGSNQITIASTSKGYLGAIVFNRESDCFELDIAEDISDLYFRLILSKNYTVNEKSTLKINLVSEEDYMYRNNSYLIPSNLVANLNKLESNVDEIEQKLANLKKPIILEVGTGKEYITLRSAIDKAWEWSETFDTEIHIFNDINLLDEYIESELNGVTYPEQKFYGVYVPKRTKLLGVGNNIKLKLMWPEPCSSHNNYLSLLNVCNDFKAENITFDGSNLRYLIHQDNHTQKTTFMKSEYINCKFLVHDGTTSAVGMGIADGGKINFKNCDFIEGQNPYAYTHLLNGHFDATSVPIILQCDDCTFDSTQFSIFEFGKENSNYINSYIILNNCYLNGVVNMAKGSAPGLNVVYKGLNNVGARAMVSSGSEIGIDNPYSFFQIGCINYKNKSTSNISQYKLLEMDSDGNLKEMSNQSNWYDFYGISMETINSNASGIVQVSGNVPTEIFNFSPNIGDLITITDGNFVTTTDINVAVARVNYSYKNRKKFISLFNK